MIFITSEETWLYNKADLCKISLKIRVLSLMWFNVDSPNL